MREFLNKLTIAANVLYQNNQVTTLIEISIYIMIGAYVLGYTVGVLAAMITHYLGY
jgi:hypothetical protein